MGMFDPFLVVVHQIYVEGVTVFEAENDPPVGGYGHAPKALQAALERVEPKARQVKIGWALRRVQVREGVRDPSCLIGLNLARVPVPVQPLQAAMPECRYH
jgi:hypothetical protein